MIWGIALIGATFLIFLLPLVPCLLEWRMKRDVAPIKILQDHDGHASFFADRFRQITKEVINDGKPVTTLLHVDYLSIGGYGVMELNADEDGGQNLFPPARRTQTSTKYPPLRLPGGRPIPLFRYRYRSHDFLCSFDELRLPNRFAFSSELYGSRDIIGGVDNQFRAVLADGHLFLGAGSSVLRWAHAETVTVSSHCQMFGRLSADTEIRMGCHCSFNRIHAPCIRVKYGSAADAADSLSAPSSLSHAKSAVWPLDSFTDGTGRKIVHGNLEFPTHGIWSGNIIVRGNVTIREGAQISGSIKAYGDLRVEKDANITGSLICQKNIFLGRACLIGGHIVAEGLVEVDSGTRIGTAQATVSVTAPTIRIANDVVVFGSIWARKKGLTVAHLK